MTQPTQLFSPYLPIEKHGVIGDRRTAALVAADGTLDWLCLPDFDSPAVFGTLLDSERGGFWRFGPLEATCVGQQHYYPDSTALVTTWQNADWTLELTDLMAEPANERPAGTEIQRTIIRRLRCIRGKGQAVLQISPRYNFQQTASISNASNGLILQLAHYRLGLWTSFPFNSPPSASESQAETVIPMESGQEWWAVLSLNEQPQAWNMERAQAAFEATLSYWHKWIHSIIYTGPRGSQVKSSASIIHLLTYAPAGSQVAAPTTSLPERIGGDRNYDYRYAWIRDASLALAMMSLLGETKAAWSYMEWLSQVCSSTEAPLQVVYRVDGGLDITQHERPDLSGYRGSRPVLEGNRAFQQMQLDSLGYMLDCAWIYLQQGCEWKEAYWTLIQQAADYTLENWHKPDSGIWELTRQAQWVSSKIMSWVTLDRAIKLAKKVKPSYDITHWQQAMEAIHNEVMEKGWSEKSGFFRQDYATENLDASSLLVSIMGFLPPDDPKVLATIEQVIAKLTINGLVHRFVPAQTLPKTAQTLPLGEFEGAFLPCTFWLVTALAKAGRVEQAEVIMQGVEDLLGAADLLPEEIDAHTKAFLGNSPLLFSHAEYLRAVLALTEAKPLDRTRLLAGQLEDKISHLAHYVANSVQNGFGKNSD